MAAIAPGAAMADEHIGVLQDVSTLVPVNDAATTPDFPIASLSHADCEVIVHIETEDGSAREFQACTLSDEPVDPAEFQGTAPEETETFSGGACGYESAYLLESQDRIVKASAYEVTVTPSGRAYVWAIFPPEPLDCS